MRNSVSDVLAAKGSDIADTSQVGLSAPEGAVDGAKYTTTEGFRETFLNCFVPLSTCLSLGASQNCVRKDPVFICDCTS